MYLFSRTTTKHLFHYLFIALLLFSACAKTDSLDPDEEQPSDHTPFTEGTIEMGMRSHGVDLGFFIKEIDFSRDDVPAQFAELAENSAEAQAFLALLEEYSENNPFAALGLMMNAVIGTYYVKDDIVLGKARGFGYQFDNYHDAKNDVGKVFMRTLVQTDEIAEEDCELSLTYVPSVDLGVGSGSSMDISIYDREVSSKSQVVAGYSCEVSTYTIKSQHIPEPDPNNPLPPTPVVYKLVVYTSDAFNKTINFTHPFYLPEEAGILKLEIYYDNGEEPTLVMQPEGITARAITDAELQIEVTEPVYSFTDIEVGWKMLAIFFSGWGALEEGG
ncbi:hypothetical protein [Parapedobacter sp. 10938]|uniref:hypothetical protein n=1 Tax=Parapedobacter flavus TaxID=3110225 RepID=UPI002DBF5DA3|nr:hypothetical protein [Parapedobacter sp. 10938]MEC3880073.1 hypothetical protein [Parapedobacter sp. 10938]